MSPTTQLCHVELPDVAHVQNATAEQSIVKVDYPVEDFEHTSTCETDSVASDLIRMYVSDDEDRLWKLAKGERNPELLLIKILQVQK